jgi:hydrophobic/amphiphilic exporter-1 (mainly G- bacteria), HAE1 family
VPSRSVQPTDTVVSPDESARYVEIVDQTARAFPVPSLELNSPEIHVVRKTKQAADMGVSTEELGYTVNALVDGAYASDYYEGGKKIDLTIIGNPDFAVRTQDLGALAVAAPNGTLTRLDGLAEFQFAGGPEQIRRRERQRAITISVTPPIEMPLETAINLVDQRIVRPGFESGEIPPEVQINLAGTADKLSATWRALRWNFVLALLVTYLLMAALFESWLYPLVIILTVPLGAVGGLLGLSLVNVYLRFVPYTMPQQLDVLTMLGFVILIGTVVNNPILIVHQSLNHMRDEGLGANEAILASVRSRIRPIFMTTITTVLGLSPLVLLPGAGSELYRGLGAVVLGGLVVSTAFTLVLVPTLFSLVVEAKTRLLAWWGFENGSPDDLAEESLREPAGAVVE